jgi:hypothetical protein
MTSLLASAQRITNETLERTAVNDVQKGGWTADAWDLFDLVGEFEFIVTSLAGRVGAARLYAGKLNQDDVTQTPEVITEAPEEVDPDTTEPRSPTDDLALAAMRAFGKTPATRAQLLERQSMNLTVTGDGWCVGIPKRLLAEVDDTISPDGVELSGIEWRVLSVSEVTKEGRDHVKLEVDGTELIVAPDDVFLIRIWDPHPRKWIQSTSPTKACLPILRELVGLTQHVGAQIDSRLAGAGMLLVPQSAEDAVRAQASDEDHDEDWNPFTEALLEHMLVPIADRSNASALVPLTLTVPDESIEKFRFISFATPLDKEARQLREEQVKRLALGMNIPPEVLLGTGGMNHWGAWMVREDTISTYVEPQLALICDALTTQYLWPVLEQQGVSEDEYTDYVIWYDVDHLVSRPNRLQDAVTLHQEEVISDAALRDAGGFGDEDAKVDTETTDEAAAIVLKMVTANPSLMRNPGIDILLKNLRALLKGDESAPVTEPIAQGELTEGPIDGELVDENGPPADGMAASAVWYPPTPQPMQININVEPADVRADIHLSDGLVAAAPPNVTVVNEVNPTPVEIYNEQAAQEPPTVNVDVSPTPVNVQPSEVAVNVEPTPVTVESNVTVPEQPAPVVNVETKAPTINVKPAPVKIVKERPTRKRIKILRRDGDEGPITGAEEIL